MKIHVKIQNRTYEVRIGDIHARPIQASVDGETFEVWPEEMTLPSEDYQPQTTSSADKPVKSVSVEGPTSSAADKIKQVKAPIPGVIISIIVSEGDKVTFGQELCILEAMKMKNAIRAGRAGTIAKVLVKEGESVQHSQVLMEYEDKG
jgi:glutaconyl-CoA/methylmalonyl-CoA decarboxylase subunit gamma